MVVALAALFFTSAAQAAPKTSTNVGYVYDFGSGVNDPSYTGSSIFPFAVLGSDPGATYTTGDSSKTVVLTDVPVSSIDSGASLTAYDTLVLYQVCDIASHPTTMTAVNNFLLNGGKVLVYDGDRCVPAYGGTPDYSSFLFPFATNNPGPKGSTAGGYAAVVGSTLTAGLSPGSQGGDAVGDSNVFTSASGPWCTSITATNTNNVTGIVEATARTASGGLVIYEGEDFWATFGPTGHLRLVFDDMLKQDWAPDGLPCTIPASGIAISPPTQSHTTGGTATLTATVTDVNGNPVSGVTVGFKVTGANAGASGTESNGGVTDASGDVTFTYTGSTTGTDSVTASFIDAQSMTHTSTTATVDWVEGKIVAAGQDLAATEGQTAAGTVATFTDGDPGSSASEYAASIDWGDGHSSTGTVSGPAGSFGVAGSHNYADEGSYPITVTITDVDNASNGAKTSSTATVADAALTASGVSPGPVSPQAFNGPVANFTDANAGGTAADFTATVDWGDGSPTSSGSVGGSGGSYVVSGSHTYAGTGFFTVKTHIVDVGGSTADATTTVLIFGSSAGGNFVIGDNSAAPGSTVTFWGAQWWKANSLSGGSAPAAFKGFGDSPGTPAACGTGWSTDPGNSSGPPAGPLPAYMAVIVSSQISKAGATISGNTRRVVVVKTNAGYAPNPGHAGTGVIVAEVCHS